MQKIRDSGNPPIPVTAYAELRTNDRRACDADFILVYAHLVQWKEISPSLNKMRAPGEGGYLG